jgi:bacillithiol system protein YtxJ
MPIRIFDDVGGADWPTVLESAPLLVLYKHSPVCMTSAVARKEIRALHKALPDVPVYQLDVIRERGLSQRVAAALQVRHESPQVLLIRNGRPVWHTSHFGIKAATLITQVERAQRARHITPEGPAESSGAA